jgi:small-conductance mechanosensitive channel
VTLEEFLSQTVFGVALSTILSIVILITVALALERLITRYLRRFARRAHLAPNVANNLILTFRLLILIGVLGFLVRAGGLPTEWFVALSTLGGAALGLASTRTIGNFVAGLYLLAARPFRVGDFVRIGNVEGIVQEFTVNYIKILTMGNNVVSVSNLQAMDRDITNFSYESEEQTSLLCYSFEIGFDHSVSSSKLAEIFSEVLEQFASTLPKKPSYMLTRSDAFTRVYLVYIYVERPDDVFVWRPRIAEEIFKRWDVERTGTNK